MKLLSIVGARPQFVKLAALCRAIDEHNRNNIPPRIIHKIVHTGQHYDASMTSIFFQQLRIPTPDQNLGVREGGQAEQISRMLEALAPVMEGERPDWVIVYGDTNSTLAGALIAARLALKLAHVEAGCRSYCFSMPEEQNRIVTDHLSQLLLCPSQRGVDALHGEGIGIGHDPRHRRVVFVGDLMLEVLRDSLASAEERAPKLLHAAGLRAHSYYLMTLHRAENTENCERLEKILNTLGCLQVPVLFPVHPRTRKLLEQIVAPLSDNLRLVQPMGYLEMLAFERYASKILTDSGGIQKESFFLGVPCVTLRNETEWPETVDRGANRLTGAAPDLIMAALQAPYPRIETADYPFGNGLASRHILSELVAAT